MTRRRTLLAGGHEQSRTVWKSVDGGQTWTNIGATLPEGTKFSSNPLLLDASTYVVNASGWGKGTGGVYHTADGGATWTQVSTLEADGAPCAARNCRTRPMSLVTKSIRYWHSAVLTICAS